MKLANRISALLLMTCLPVALAVDAGTVRRLRSEFRNPPREFTQAPFWFWNGEISEDGIRRQLDGMQEKGVHGFVIHGRMGLSKEVGYMTPRWLELTRFAVEEAERRGMMVYLYDEGMYPSGSAHGEVVKGRPELASQGLAMATGEAPDEDGVVLRRDGYTFRLVPSGGVIRGVHFDEEDNKPGAPASADLLNPEATERFIKFTHERYRQAVGAHFGKTVRGIFTDEPSILGRRSQKGLQPWTKGLLPKLNAIAGYDLGPYLHLLWEESADGLHEVVRTDYRRAVAAVLADTYYRPISEWCERNGVALTGHPHGGGDLPPQRLFHQPGQDIVWRWVLPGETATEGEQSLTGKTASSMALHLGRETVINECYGAYGWRLTMSEMKWLADWLFVRGTNLLMPHAFYYSVEGPRLRERPPDLAWANLWWEHYEQFADYTSRQSWLMRGGEPVVDVAILAHEGEANWRAAQVLLENQIEFFYLDEEMLDNAKIEGGRLQVGPASYSVVVLDGVDHARPETMERLRRLTSGRVALVSFKSPLRPHPLVDGPPSPRLRMLPVQRTDNARGLLSAVRAKAAPDIEALDPAPGLRYAHRIKDGVSFYLLTNEGDDHIATTIRVQQTSTPEAWDAETGRFGPAAVRRKGRETVEVPVALRPRNSTILAFTGQAAASARPMSGKGAVVQLDSGWALEAAGQSFDAGPGSWTRLPELQAFSGTGWYELEFQHGEPAGRYEIDLGDVREIADVELNGRPLGVRLWPPYRFDATPALQAGRNRLRIGVTNTRANELTDEKLTSGLLGPVQLIATEDE